MEERLRTHDPNQQQCHHHCNHCQICHPKITLIEIYHHYHLTKEPPSLLPEERKASPRTCTRVPVIFHRTTLVELLKPSLKDNCSKQPHVKQNKLNDESNCFQTSMSYLPIFVSAMSMWKMSCCDMFYRT